MDAKPVQMYEIITSNQGLQSNIDRLESQMKGLNPSSSEYLFDELHLNSEIEELNIREAHHLDPTEAANQQDKLAENAELQKWLDQDPVYQCDATMSKLLSLEHYDECTRWGIPMSNTTSNGNQVVPVQG
jgi:hypothetical protein